jgi:phosphohistidine phosphatase
MKLYVIRHADAEPRTEATGDDAERPLTPQGFRQGEALAEGLRRQKVSLSKVYTSPLLRARQTAEEMLKHWQKPAPELVVCERLTPGSKRKALAKFLRDQEGSDLAIVGHEPDLSAFIAWLIGNKKVQIQLEKAGVACIAFDEQPGKGNGRLEWLVTPEWLGG